MEDTTYSDALFEGFERGKTERDTLRAEIARLQKALLKCAAIPHMGQYTGSQVKAAIEESKPWTVTPKS